MATEKKIYKYGPHDLDFNDYIYQLRQNILGYTDYLALKKGLNQLQIDEVKNSYDRYMAVLLDQLANNSNRLYTDDHGKIKDDYYYDSAGNKISGEDYGKLTGEDLKKYSNFLANGYFENFANSVGLMLSNKSAEKPKLESTNKYDSSKHGWNTWWTANFGRHLLPYIEEDELVDGKRGTTNRANKLQGYINQYIDYLSKLDIDWSGHHLGNFDDVKGRLVALRDGLKDGYNHVDKQAFLQAGIDSSWYDPYFTDKEKYSETPELDDADKKAKEEKAKQELEEKDWDDWFNAQYDNYVNNSGNYNDDNEYYFGQLPEQTMDEIRDSFGKGTDYQNYINEYLKNPFNNKDPRALNMLIQSKYATALEDGSYYIKLDNDWKNGMGLIYNPITGRMKYTFIGNIKPEWSKMKNKRDIDRGSKKRSSLYRQEGGTIESMQIGGSFDFNTFMGQDRLLGIDERAKANGKTSKQQEAGERYINSANASMLNPDAGFSNVELTRLASIGGDITSMIVGMCGGNVASTAIGAASTTANLFADIADDNTSAWDTFKNAAFGYGMDIVGAIPVFGATGKMAKMAKSALSVAPKAMAVIGTLSGVANAENYYNSWKKLVDTDGKVTVEDWRNIAASIQLLAGGTAAVARQRAVNKAGKTDMVAMDFVDKNTGAKQTRIFEGADAKALRDANGDLTKLKEATTGKFEELKDLNLDITGTKEGIPLFGKKWGAKEGTARVYDVKNGTNGLFVERGWATPDEMTTGMRRPGLSIEDANIARTAAQDAEIATQLNPLKNQSDAIDRSMARKDGKITSLESDINAKLAQIDAENAAYTGRSSSDINADLTRIRDAHASGEFTRREAIANKRKTSGVLDEVDAAGNVTKQGKTSAALSRNILRQREVNTMLRTKTDASGNKLTKKQLKALADEKIKLEANALKIKDVRAKQIADNAADTEYLKNHDTALEAGLNTELASATAHDTAIKELTDGVIVGGTRTPGLNQLKARLDAWKQLNDPNFRSAPRKKFEAAHPVDAEGNVEFTLASGDKVKRNWQEILTRYGIKHKQGGNIIKFEEGGKSNITGSLNWFDHMYSTDIKDFLNGNFDDAAILAFNARQKLWHDNKSSTGWIDGASTVNYSNDVRAYQSNWNQLGLNKGIAALRASGATVGHGSDSEAGGWTDGYFGTQESIRHGGSSESWKGHETELAELLKSLKARGLNYTLNTATGMYELSKIEAPEQKPEVTPKLTPALDSKASATGLTYETQETEETPLEPLPSFKLFKPNLTMLYGLPRLFSSLSHNDRVRALEDAKARIMDLTDPFLFTRYVYSDLNKEQAGNNHYGRLMHLARLNQTADSSLNKALMLDAANSGLTALSQGMAESNAVADQNRELNWQQQKENAANVHANRAANLTKLLDGQEQLLTNQQTNKVADFLARDIFGLQLEQEAKLNQSMQQSINDRFAQSHIHEIILRNPDAAFTRFGIEPMTEEEKAIFLDLSTGAKKQSDYVSNPAYTTLIDKLSKTENRALLEYYGVSWSSWQSARQYHKKVPNYTPTFYTLGTSYKKGGTIEEKLALLNAKNRAKDIEHFHKNINKDKDRLDKAYDRIAKRKRK